MFRNKCFLMGYLGSDPELKETPNHNKVVNVNLCTNETYTSNGEKVVKTTWHTLVFWGKKAELIARVCKKGSHVDVSGRIEQREWTGKDNVKRYDKVVVVNDIIFLDKKSQANEAERRRSPAAPAGDEVFPGDTEDLHVPDTSDEYLEDDIPM